MIVTATPAFHDIGYNLDVVIHCSTSSHHRLHPTARLLELTDCALQQLRIHQRQSAVKVPLHLVAAKARSEAAVKY